ncbi:MAG: thermostable hemolysin [Pseudomonadota bacterium]
MDGGTSRMLARAQSAGAGSDDLSGALLARRRRTFDAAASSFFALETPDTRPEAEALIRTAFMRAYGARIERFLPLLMGLRDGEGSLLAACGLRYAALSPLFLEAYLDRPVEAALSATAGETLRRGDVIEAGNLAVARGGHAPLLIAALTRHLHESGQRWVVFTAVPALANAFKRLGIALTVLAPALLSALPAADQIGWGTYYDRSPRVMACRVAEAYRALAA